MEVLTSSLAQALMHLYINLPPLGIEGSKHSKPVPILLLCQDFADNIGRVVNNGHNAWVDHTFRPYDPKNTKRTVIIAVGVGHKATLTHILKRCFGANDDMHPGLIQTLIQQTDQAVFFFKSFEE